MRVQLHFDFVAPAGVTLPFLLVAPFLGALAAALLMFGGADLLLSRWHPMLLGALHVYSIGFVLFSIAGAILQIGPVLSARPALHSGRVAGLLRVALGIGAVLFGCGMFHQNRALLAVGLLLLLPALASWLLLAVRGVGVSKKSLAMLISITGLAIGVAIGARLALGHAFPSIGLPRHLTDQHAAWMLLGGVAPLVMAVGFIVIPMFQHTRPLPRFAAWLPLPAVGGLLLNSMCNVHGGTLLAGTTLMAFAFTVLVVQARRAHGSADATFRLFRFAMLSAIAGLVAWFAASWLPEWTHRLQWFGAIMLLAGFAGSAVQAMALKIVPFLLRLRLQRLLWQQRHAAVNLPGFQQLLREQEARLLPPLQYAAVVLLGFAATSHNTLAFHAGAVLLLASQLALGVLLLRAVRNATYVVSDLAPEPDAPSLLEENWNESAQQ